MAAAYVVAKRAMTIDGAATWFDRGCQVGYAATCSETPSKDMPKWLETPKKSSNSIVSA
jgi:hypothetical protein